MKNIFFLLIIVIYVFTISLVAKEPNDIAKEIISEQIAFLKSGDLEKFKACFTERQKVRINKEKMQKAQKEITKYTLDDLVDFAAEGEFNGDKTLKIKMKNGRTLTTLIFHNGKWLADTIWFR